MPANTTFTAGQVLTAAQQNNFPLGVVTATAGGTSGSGFVRNTTIAVSIPAAETDVSGMTVTFAASTSRIYKYTVTLSDIFSGGGMSPFVLNVTDAANVVQYQARRIFPAGDVDTMTISFVETGLTGSIVRKVRVAGITNTGTFNSNAASALSVFTVEDIGAA
jgi:hypothetical protein